jgi:ubiquinone/menaquinone biosynthesis C-methylase UbiE
MQIRNPFINPDVAARYDFARQMPQETIGLWLDRLKSAVSAFNFQPRYILDLGCGTGRFTPALAKTFNCQVVGIEPSEAMLSVAKRQRDRSVARGVGTAEEIPLRNKSVDLVFMSQVFHHLGDPTKAIQEIYRVLTGAGFLAIRNSTRENNLQIEWLKFFPEASAIEDKRIPAAEELGRLVCRHQFELVTRETVEQYFAASYSEYCEKIKTRGLSSLSTISDEAFESGLRRFKEWVNLQPFNVPVHEPIDLFVFRKMSA